MEREIKYNSISNIEEAMFKLPSKIYSLMKEPYSFKFFFLEHDVKDFDSYMARKNESDIKRCIIYGNSPYHVFWAIFKRNVIEVYTLPKQAIDDNKQKWNKLTKALDKAMDDALDGEK